MSVIFGLVQYEHEQYLCIKVWLSGIHVTGKSNLTIRVVLYVKHVSVFFTLLNLKCYMLLLGHDLYQLDKD